MRRILFWMLMLVVICVGCDTSEVPAPPGAEKAETSLDVDMGSDESEDSQGGSSESSEAKPQPDGDASKSP